MCQSPRSAGKYPAKFLDSYRESWLNTCHALAVLVSASMHP